MSGLNEYIKKIEKYIDNNPDITEELLIRHVYLDLGNRFSFNSRFLPFGNARERKQIYSKGNSIEEMNNCMENNTVICNSASKILEYVLKHFGVKIKTVKDANDERKYPHVYNIIYPKDGSEAYSVDLQEDMYRIQMHGFTTNFGISTKDFKTQVIPRFKQEQMDRKLGYIDDEHYYTDDYLYLLKSDIEHFETFEEKVDFLLENIEVFDNSKMKYTDRQWYHVRILQNFFNTKEFNYMNNSGRIHIIDCYKEIGETKKYINCISVQCANKNKIYLYSVKDGKYKKIELENLAKAVKNGLKLYKGNIQGLGGALKRLEKKEMEK